MVDKFRSVERLQKVKDRRNLSLMSTANSLQVRLRPSVERATHNTIRISSPLRGPLRFHVPEPAERATLDDINRVSKRLSDNFFVEANFRKPLGVNHRSEARYMSLYSNAK